MLYAYIALYAIILYIGQLMMVKYASRFSLADKSIVFDIMVHLEGMWNELTPQNS